MNDKDLIEAIKKDPKQFGAIYDAHYSTIFNYCFKRTQDFNTSKDIVSETFLKAFLNIGRFKWKGISIKSWLYKIATNEVNLHYRSKTYHPRLLNDIGAKLSATTKSMEDEKIMAEKELEKHEQFLKVQKVLYQLPVKYQDVISLKYFEKLKIKEISAILGKPEGTVKSILSRGLNMLKDKL